MEYEYIYIYIYILYTRARVCVCVCVCARARALFNLPNPFSRPMALGFLYQCLTYCCVCN
jgi:hypothetical protein